MQHHAAFHQSLHCLQKYPFGGFISSVQRLNFSLCCLFFLILEDKTCYDHVNEQIIMSCSTEMWNFIYEYNEEKRCRCVCSGFISKY